MTREMWLYSGILVGVVLGLIAVYYIWQIIHSRRAGGVSDKKIKDLSGKSAKAKTYLTMKISKDEGITFTKEEKRYGPPKQLLPTMPKSGQCRMAVDLPFHSLIAYEPHAIPLDPNRTPYKLHYALDMAHDMYVAFGDKLGRGETVREIVIWVATFFGFVLLLVLFDKIGRLFGVQ